MSEASTVSKAGERGAYLSFYGPGEGKKFAMVELSPSTFDAFKRAARREGKTLGEWVESTLGKIIMEREWSQIP